MKMVISIIIFSLLSGIAASFLDLTIGPLSGWVRAGIGVPFGILGFVVGALWEEL